MGVVLVAILAGPALAIYQSTFDPGTGDPPYENNTTVIGKDGWYSVNGTNWCFTDVWGSGDPGNHGGTLQLKTGTVGLTRYANHVLEAENPTGDVTVTIDFLGGIGTLTNGYVWEFKVQNLAENADNAYWWGFSNTAVARLGSTTVAVPGTLNRDAGEVWTLKSISHVATGMTEYWYDKHDGLGMVHLTDLSGYASTSADIVHFGALRNSSTDNWTAFDNLNIPEPATMLLLCLGGLLTLRRRGV
jgi:hypothetical protein